MKPRTRALLFAGVILIIISLLFFTDIRPLLTSTLDWIDSLGVWGMVIFVVLYALSAVFFVPASILTLGAGFLYGLVLGTILVSIASTAGAVGAFLTGRYFAKDWIREKIGGKEKIEALDRAIAKEGWKIIVLTRMSPILPYNGLNYAYSLTRVSLKHYFWASWVGMLPWTVVYVYIGTLASNIVMLGQQERTPLEWSVLIIGFIFTVFLVWYVAKVAKRALNESIDTAL